MSARLLLRGEDGVIQSVGVDQAARISRVGEGALVIDATAAAGDGARITAESGGWWIDEAEGRLDVRLNGERTGRARMRHLDVVTIGADAHVIFLGEESESAPPRPDQPAAAEAPATPAAEPAPPVVVAAAPATVLERPAAVPMPVAPDPPVGAEVDEAGATVYERPHGMLVAFPDTEAPVVVAGEAGATVYERLATPMPSLLKPMAEVGLEPADATVFERLPGILAPPPIDLEEDGPVLAPPAGTTGDGPAAPTAADARETALPAGVSLPDLPFTRPPTAAGTVVGLRLVGPAGTFELPLGRSIVGRGRNATVRIDDKEVSRVHAAIVIAPDAATIEDLGSANGTTVNGVPTIAARTLVDGDRVSLGRLEFRSEFTRLDGDV